ncbi:MAG: uroporphyrinogen decarboxylase [Rhodospirillales bacterium]|nr:uroporphyrinogen decarboxylase [Rhodospirillales bacterium]MCB9964666.1 uroporphyrinogen decarboxylase [Rhodospirillales bacterium]MCB9979956.1 uroporphyrinogen decarboxylase [Rhodospirillales bacterium]
MSVMSDEKPFLNVLKNRAISGRTPPWWLMRQAGRYLPEYREIRARAGGFLDLVYHPELACDVTLQPIRRYGMSAAILFSDILVLPQALGQEVRFETGEGPKLGDLDLSRLGYKKFKEVLSPVYETVSRIRGALAEEGFHQTALIGFCGAPWTVACYMVEGGGSKEFHKVKTLAYADPEKFQALLELLTEASITYLQAQIEAGAEAIQIFDSWAGVLDEDGFRRFVIAPTKKIVQSLKQKYPEVPIIGFPRGAGTLYLPYVQETGVDGVSLDPSVSTGWAAEVLQPLCTVQGNLDPVRLMAGGDGMIRAVEKILSDLKNGPYIFNLGHGVIKETAPAQVDMLKTLLRVS